LQPCNGTRRYSPISDDRHDAAAAAVGKAVGHNARRASADE